MYEYETITGRKEKKPDIEKYKELLKGKKILITGIGSIGHGLVNILSKFDVRLILTDIREEALAFICDELNTSGFKNYETYLLDLKDARSVKVLAELEPYDFIINTAAYKHVVFCEDNAEEAFINNIQIAENILKLSVNNANILISSDKAVHPSNVMGMTKRTNELLYMQKDKTKIIRFGNVYGSSGSLVPRVSKCIDMGQVLVTDENATRYFMTRDEACGLILSAMFSNKLINILDMGEPLNIHSLIRKMIEVSGKEVRVMKLGLLSGEKMNEELEYPNKVSLEKAREELTRFTRPIDIYINLDKFDWDVE